VHSISAQIRTIFKVIGFHPLLNAKYVMVDSVNLQHETEKQAKDY
jgi:hypothetical protein